MLKSKKRLIFTAALCLLLAGLWLYWEYPMTMDALMPEEVWTKMELRYGTAGERQTVEYLDPELDRVLPQMNTVRLTRSEDRPYLDDQHFQILLYKGKAYPTMLYVGSSGRIEIAEELDFDSWKYYEGGEAFYRYLQSYSKTLTAVYNVAQ